MQCEQGTMALARKRRIKNFHIELTSVDWDDEWSPGCISGYFRYTTNGRQFTVIELAPREAQKMIDALQGFLNTVSKEAGQ